MTSLAKQLHVSVGTLSYGKGLHDSAVACTSPLTDIASSMYVNCYMLFIHRRHFDETTLFQHKVTW